ncbi:MAG: hypothetical protein PHU85_10190, partial [Phycisphaerae bacterium]|nr:hypothetical protein [Phycisphaerae bacterium]
GEGGKFNRQIVMTVVLRKPLAQVWHSVGSVPYCYVLDAKGYVLARSETGVGDLPRLTNFATPVDESKRRLNDLPVGAALLKCPDILAGLALLAKLENQPYFSQISEISVANYDRKRNRDTSELVLVTHAIETFPPQVIGWGARLDLPENTTDCNTADEKVLILRNVWTGYGRLNLMDRVPAGPYNLWQQQGKPWYEQGSQNAVSPPTPTQGTRTSRHAAGHG